MPLQAGTRLGPHEIVSPLGVGGMGEVYRATDTNLKRQVAIKVLPESVAGDADRLARFRREAEVLASLNHPNIAHIYGMEEGPAEAGHHVRALVMELVEGEDLSQRIARGAIPLANALAIARQIADALEAAHEQGIVHRDLKPANIKVRPDGTVKVLDFGLAKAMDQVPGSGFQVQGSAALTNSPTITVSAMTNAGSILGTAAYMSPQQARGLAVDKRADIWAFGCVCYEMLTGRATFRGATVTDILVAILEREPDWTALPSTTPPAITRLLRRCLEKDPKQRLRDIGDARTELASSVDVDDMPAGTPRAFRWGTKPLLAAAALTAVVISASVALTVWLRPAPSHAAAPTGTIRLSVPPPPGTSFAGDVERVFLALSPDGSQLAFVATEPSGPNRIWVRPVSAVDAHPLAGTDGATSLFWSPDGGAIAFFSEGKLKRLDLPAGAAVPLCDAPEAIGLTGTWGTNGEILFASVEGNAIFSVSSAGGTPAALVKPDPAQGETRVNWPAFLPDGKRFLYLTRIRSGDGYITLGERGRPPRRILAAVSNAQWVDPQFLIFAREGVLMAQRFDLETERTVGGPFPVAEPLDYFFATGKASFTASRNGTLAYQSHTDIARLVWIDRTGKEVGSVGVPGSYQSVRISADGQRLVFDRASTGLGTQDVWTLDLRRGVETRLTSAPGSEAYPVWLPDGRSVIYMASGGIAPRLFRKDLATGAEEEMVPGGSTLQQPTDVSADGTLLAFMERTARGNFDLFTLPLTKPGKPTLLFGTQFDEVGMRFSPDGRAVAFVSNESGRYEVYVAPYPTGAKIRISTGGAEPPRWSHDGRELFYQSEGNLMAVSVQTAPSLELGIPKPLFAISAQPWMSGQQSFRTSSFEVSPDGKQFLAIVSEVVASRQPVTVVVNWIAERAAGADGFAKPAKFD